MLDVAALQQSMADTQAAVDKRIAATMFVPGTNLPAFNTVMPDTVLQNQQDAAFQAKQSFVLGSWLNGVQGSQAAAQTNLNSIYILGGAMIVLLFLEVIL